MRALSVLVRPFKGSAATMSLLRLYSGYRIQNKWTESSVPTNSDQKHPIKSTVSVKPPFSFTGSLTICGLLNVPAADPNTDHCAIDAPVDGVASPSSVFVSKTIEFNDVNNTITLELFGDQPTVKTLVEHITPEAETGGLPVTKKRKVKDLTGTSQKARERPSLDSCRKAFSAFNVSLKEATQRLDKEAGNMLDQEMQRAKALVLDHKLRSQTSLQSNLLMCKALFVTGNLPETTLLATNDFSSFGHSFLKDTNEGNLVYTDGSFTLSKTASSGGYGVFWAIDDLRNTFGVVPDLGSNLEAEIFAILVALKQIKLEEPGTFTILTDSISSLEKINSCALDTKKAPKFAKEVFDLYVQLIAAGFNVKINWVRGHNSNPGNHAAHKLATKGLNLNFPEGRLPSVVLKTNRCSSPLGSDIDSLPGCEKLQHEKISDQDPYSQYLPPKPKSTQQPLRKGQVIYTDGSSRNNGRDDAAAGQGVYWGENDHRNFSGPVSGRQTNNRAELSALISAFHQISFHPTGKYIVKVDSTYVKDALKNSPQWAKNNWRNSSGAVKNLDLIQKMFELHNSLLSRGYNMSIEKVLGHSGDFGNDRADQLATAHAELVRARSPL